MEENEKDQVNLVAGLINATEKMLFWKDEIGSKLGDYAIVQNNTGYDLIKVVGIIETTKKNARKFSNTDYDNMKSVRCTLSEELFK